MAIRTTLAELKSIAGQDSEHFPVDDDFARELIQDSDTLTARLGAAFGASAELAPVHDFLLFAYLHPSISELENSAGVDMPDQQSDLFAPASVELRQRLIDLVLNEIVRLLRRPIEQSQVHYEQLRWYLQQQSYSPAAQIELLTKWVEMIKYQEEDKAVGSGAAFARFASVLDIVGRTHELRTELQESNEVSAFQLEIAVNLADLIIESLPEISVAAIRKQLADNDIDPELQKLVFANIYKTLLRSDELIGMANRADLLEELGELGRAA